MVRGSFLRPFYWSLNTGQENNPRTSRMEVYGCECRRRRHLSLFKLTSSRGSVVYRMGLDTPVAHAVNDECLIWAFYEFRFKPKAATLHLGSKIARLKLKGISCRVDRRWNIAVETIQRVTPHHSLNTKIISIKLYCETQHFKI